MKKHYLSLIMGAACLAFAVSSVEAFSAYKAIKGVKAGKVKAKSLEQNRLRLVIRVLKEDKLFKKLGEGFVFGTMGKSENLLHFVVDSLCILGQSDDVFSDDIFVGFFKTAYTNIRAKYENLERELEDIKDKFIHRVFLIRQEKQSCIEKECKVKKWLTEKGVKFDELDRVISESEEEEDLYPYLPLSFFDVDVENK
jgi:hypothetical protein